MAPVQLLISKDPVDYDRALGFMEARVAKIQEKKAIEALWLLEHPPLYTAGTSAQPHDFLGTQPFPVFRAGRGGQYTYHGPGQRVAYLMLDLNARGRDVRAFVSLIERWVIAALGEFSLIARTYRDRVGVWVEARGGEAKIAAIGIRLKKWISFHGVAINVAPNLNHFTGIVPCGIRDRGVTSLEDLGLPVSVVDFDVALLKHFASVFAAPLTRPNSPDI